MSRGFCSSALVKKKTTTVNHKVRVSYLVVLLHVACTQTMTTGKKKKGFIIATFGFNKQVYGRLIQILNKTL
jgi:hypothetical protein